MLSIFSLSSAGMLLRPVEVEFLRTVSPKYVNLASAILVYQLGDHFCTFQGHGELLPETGTLLVILQSTLVYVYAY